MRLLKIAVFNVLYTSQFLTLGLLVALMLPIMYVIDIYAAIKERP